MPQRENTLVSRQVDQKLEELPGKVKEANDANDQQVREEFHAWAKTLPLEELQRIQKAKVVAGEPGRPGLDFQGEGGLKTGETFPGEISGRAKDTDVEQVPRLWPGKDEDAWGMQTVDQEDKPNYLAPNTLKELKDYGEYYKSQPARDFAKKWEESDRVAHYALLRQGLPVKYLYKRVGEDLSPREQYLAKSNYYHDLLIAHQQGKIVLQPSVHEAVRKAASMGTTPKRSEAYIGLRPEAFSPNTLNKTSQDDN